MTLKAKKRMIYAIGFVLFTTIEILIAIYIHDDFVRPYLGDVLVVVVIYCFVRTLLPERLRLLPLYIFLFAASVEMMQLLNLLALLGLERYPLAKIVFGTTFDSTDIICYFTGCALLALFELCILKTRASHQH